MAGEEWNFFNPPALPPPKRRSYGRRGVRLGCMTFNDYPYKSQLLGLTWHLTVIPTVEKKYKYKNMPNQLKSVSLTKQY